jgi:hydroxymethylbilane synthase
VRDAWISPHHASLADLPYGAVVGTSSARRAAQLLHQRPDVKIVELRGNVQTRLQKITDGVAEATFLAAAGLIRLGLEKEIRQLIPTDEILPAAAQGAIGIECAEARADILALLATINHAPTQTCITAERAMLLELDGSCRTPIGGLAELRGDTLHVQGEVLSLDGRIRHHHALTGAASDAEKLGFALGLELRAMAGEALLNHG